MDLEQAGVRRLVSFVSPRDGRVVVKIEEHRRIGGESKPDGWPFGPVGLVVTDDKENVAVANSHKEFALAKRSHRACRDSQQSR